MGAKRDMVVARCSSIADLNPGGLLNQVIIVEPLVRVYIHLSWRFWGGTAVLVVNEQLVNNRRYSGNDRVYCLGLSLLVAKVCSWA